MANRWGNNNNSDRLYLLGLQKSLWIFNCSYEIKRCLLSGAMTSPDSKLKKQRHHFANKGPYKQSCGFYSSPVRFWEWDHKEGWAPKNWCFQSVVLEKTLESPLDNKEFKQVNPKGKQPWIFTGRTNAEALTHWSPDVKNWLTGKDPWCWEGLREVEKGATENEMVGIITKLTQRTWV